VPSRFEVQGDVDPGNLRGASASVPSASYNMRGAGRRASAAPGSSNSEMSSEGMTSEVGITKPSNGGGSEDVVEGNTEMHQNTQFIDQTAGTILNFDTPRRNFASDDVQHNIDLANYLSRPVRITTYTWLESQTIGTGSSFVPWYLYLNNPTIKNKLQNYNFMRGKLHLKFMVNASPFYYGSSLINYVPLNGFSSPTIVTDSVRFSQIIPYSQMPHVWLYPQTNQGGEIVCPFFLYKPWLDITSANEVRNMGSISYQVVNQLTSANGVTGVGVDVVVYAWMEDVEFLGTTSQPVLQTDEYATGIISKPASALATALGKLKDIPIIGPYATATSMISKGVGQLAYHMGYSNPPEISDTKNLKPQPFPNFASTDISQPNEKLAIDSKNELSIDPSIVGLPSHDELAITYMNQRESYLTTFDYASTNSLDDVLFQTQIQPKFFDADLSATHPNINSTPMCYVSNLFRYWRGDIILRFKVVCTQYHKGRMQIMFDPNRGSLVGSSTDSSQVFTQIIDIGATNDFEFRVPYMSDTPWLPIDSDYSTRIFGSVEPGTQFCNGIVTVRVLNRLTAPLNPATIHVQVFVRGAENLEYACPITTVNKATYYPILTGSPAAQPDNVELNELQTADEIDYEAPIQYSIAEKSGASSENRYLINMGEKITSLRQLFRRDNYIDTYAAVADTTSFNFYTEVLTQGRYPPLYGYDTNGYSTTAAASRFNYSSTPAFNWISMMFIGMRGSVNWTFNVNKSDEQITDIRSRREQLTRSTTILNVAGSTATSSSGVSWFYQQTANDGSGGQTITHQATQAGVGINVPFYTNALFHFTSPAYRNLGSTLDGSATDTIVTQFYVMPALHPSSDAKGIVFNRYFSIGPDFTFYMFLCCPTYFILSSAPSPS